MSLLFSKYRNLSVEEKKLIYRALRIYFIAFLWVRFSPFKKFERKLGERNKEKSTQILNNKNIEKIILVRRTIRRLKKMIPWKTKCFEEAIVGKKILELYNLKSNLFLGGTIKNSIELKAHAWLKCGEVFVTGRNGHKNYKVLNVYS